MRAKSKVSSKASWSVYSEYEGGFLRGFHEYRIVSLSGLLRLLTRVGITANHVSVMSAIAAILFIPAFARSTALAVLALLLHLVLDGLDGPLAKFQKTAGNAGMLVDFTADLIGIMAVTIGLTAGGVLEPVVAVLYASLYTSVVFMALIHSMLAIKQSFTFRPRMFVYGFIIGMYVVEKVFNTHLDLIQEVTVVSCVLMAYLLAKDVLRLYAVAKSSS